MINSEFMGLWFDTLCNEIYETRPFVLYSPKTFRESISFANRPIRIGNRTFRTGLAMLTDSFIEVRSTVPIIRLQAMAGLDNNPIARRMVLSSVIFSIEAEKDELWRSLPLTQEDDAHSIDLPLNGVYSITIKAVMVNEKARNLKGYYAHADYADITLEFADGTIYSAARTLEQLRLEQAIQPPVSFQLDGYTSAEFFKKSHRETSVTETEDKRSCVIRYNNAQSGLVCSLEGWRFHDSPVVEWIVRFTNESSSISPILTEVNALDILWPSTVPASLHCARGSGERPDDFQYLIKDLETIRSDYRSIYLRAGEEGRSSVAYLPFMNIVTINEGLIVGVGWSGQWSAEVGRETSTGAIRIRVKMEGIYLRLYPGESIRTPRILLLHWNGEPMDGNNLLRHYILEHYVLWDKNQNFNPPACLSTWGGQPTRKHLSCIKRLTNQNLRYDCYWVDAGWYGTSSSPCPNVFAGDWCSSVGDWRVNRTYHPHGLKALSNKIHRSNMKFMLWVEIESARYGTPITLKHPEWFLSKNPDFPKKEGETLLLNLGNPQAFAYALETLTELIKANGVDWYRQDFNMNDIIDYWRANDAQERRGITQIRHIEGLYALWDELRRKFPHLVIDNCASGGRRIDLETLTRSLPLWRSDYGCFANAKAEALQVQSAGLSCWIPIHGGGCICPPGDTYYFRSNLSPALTDCNDIFFSNEEEFNNYPWDWYRKMLTEYYRMRPLFLGNFYPLTSISLLSDIWMAYQWHRADINRGMVLTFRRAQSPYSTAFFHLKGLSPEGSYHFENVDSGKCWDVTTQSIEKNGLKISLTKPRSSCLLFYTIKNKEGVKNYV